MSLRKKFSFSLDMSAAKAPRKYLGDPSDPHFVPDSPLISRPAFTAQEEAELRRVCTSLLANIPHSDEMLDDPLRYLAGHVRDKSDANPLRDGIAKEPVLITATRQQTITEEYDTPNMPPWLSQHDDTTTPSEASGHETADTDYSTRVTTPGITTDEHGKRSSDVAKRPSTAHPSGLRIELKSKGPHKMHLATQYQQQPLKSRYSASVPAIKSMTHLPQPLYGPKGSDDAHQVPKPPISRPNFNKSLPALPQVSHVPHTMDPESRAERSGGLSRILKTVKRSSKKPTSKHESRDASADVPRHIVEVLGPIPESNSSKKHRFEFSALFSRRKAYHVKRATVS